MCFRYALPIGFAGRALHYSDLSAENSERVDLANNEVKSSKRGGGYEYQYHKNRGREDLARHILVGHLFFDYSENLREVDLRYLHGSELVEFFTKWLVEFPDPYGQRYRKSLPYGYVKEHGKLLMTIKDGEVVFPIVENEAIPVIQVSQDEGVDAQADN